MVMNFTFEFDSNRKAVLFRDAMNRRRYIATIQAVIQDSSETLVVGHAVYGSPMSEAQLGADIQEAMQNVALVV